MTGLRPVHAGAKRSKIVCTSRHVPWAAHWQGAGPNDLTPLLRVHYSLRSSPVDFHLCLSKLAIHSLAVHAAASAFPATPWLEGPDRPTGKARGNPLYHNSPVDRLSISSSGVAMDPFMGVVWIVATQPMASATAPAADLEHFLICSTGGWR